MVPQKYATSQLGPTKVQQKRLERLQNSYLERFERQINLFRHVLLKLGKVLKAWELQEKFLDSKREADNAKYLCHNAEN